MGTFYFDLETTGLDAKKDKIISIQIQELDKNTGKPIGDLVILKEWESSEKQILIDFIKESGINESYPFSFVPVGYNLRFEHNFIKERATIHGLPATDILSKPFIDLQALGILMNKGEFKGSGLDKITGKETDGSQVPKWYAAKDFDRIVHYIENETECFLKFNAWLYAKLPSLLLEFKKEQGLDKGC